MEKLEENIKDFYICKKALLRIKFHETYIFEGKKEKKKKGWTDLRESKEEKRLDFKTLWREKRRKIKIFS